MLSAGFRPFFLLASLWSAIAIPAWLAAYMHAYAVPGPLPAMLWHGHEMVYGFGLAVVTGFLLTAVPNWTGRLPLRGWPLAALAALWLAGRFAPVLDLAFGATLLVVVAREVALARNAGNYPIVAVLAVLLAGNTLVHLQALGLADTAALGNRIGVATLLALVALIGGRIIPSFTRNWLAKNRPEVAAPAPFSRLDVGCLAATVLALVAWVSYPDSAITHALEIAGGVAVASRLSRWRGLATLREPLVLVLHAGHAWLALGLLLLGLDLAPGAGLHALTVGAIGTMTLAVMTRASLGHGGRPLAAGAGTIAIYLLVTAAALLRTGAAFSSPAFSSYYAVLTSFAGLAWSAAFALFAFLYGPLLLRTKP